jgi:uncharacterized protein YdeI (YjbR/CyaY-like superfamily)
VKPENVRFFDSQARFREWLEANHTKAPFQWVGFWKKAAQRRGLTYDEAVLEALCFGWIDGQTNRVDDLSVTVRFSPRRAGSNWSELNIGRVKDLEKAGKMHAAGLRAFEARREPGPGTYTYETRPSDLPQELEAVFRINAQAWTFWREQTPGYRKSMTWWILSAKRDETRQRRLAAVMDESAKGNKISDTNLPKLSPQRGKS